MVSNSIPHVQNTMTSRVVHLRKVRKARARAAKVSDFYPPLQFSRPLTPGSCPRPTFSLTAPQKKVCDLEDSGADREEEEDPLRTLSPASPPPPLLRTVRMRPFLNNFGKNMKPNPTKSWSNTPTPVKTPESQSKVQDSEVLPTTPFGDDRSGKGEEEESGAEDVEEGKEEECRNSHGSLSSPDCRMKVGSSYTLNNIALFKTERGVREQFWRMVDMETNRVIFIRAPEVLTALSTFSGGKMNEATLPNLRCMVFKYKGYTPARENNRKRYKFTLSIL